MTFEFPVLLAHYRQQTGVTQSELARRAGISASYVNRLEKGQREPSSRDLVLKMAEALALSPSETDTLLKSADYAPEMVPQLTERYPVLGLMADILEDDSVSEKDIDLLMSVVNLINRQRGSPRADKRNTESPEDSDDV